MTIRERNGDVQTAVVDARDPDALASFFATVDQRFGGLLHILVNVVGGTFRQPFADSNPRGWQALVRANFTWMLHSTQLAIPRMRAAGCGSVINLTSIEAHRAAPEFAVYAAMKAAVTSFSRTLAVELGPDRIRVNTIAPDLVPTEGTRAMDDVASEPAAVAALSDRIAIPMGRRGTYEDVGGCALFLASDLSGYVTGTTLHPDGGALAASGQFSWPGGHSPFPPRSVIDALLGEAGSE
jgi:NAD(P)-dependent dehydrogenase (short-subunit alcohol dehydrogenase family)